MVDPAIVRWRRENRKLGRTIGPNTERGKANAKKIREVRATPDPTKRKWF